MPRMLIGSFVAAIAMFVTGFIFFVTPLGGLAYSTVGEQQQANIQQVLSANLAQKTGTYQIPRAEQSAQMTILYGTGPVATVHYNRGGFAPTSTDQLISGFFHELIVALLMGFALLTVAVRVPDFVSRAKLVVLFSVAGGVLAHLGEPIWYHHDWGHFIYLFVGDTAMLVVGGLIIARWFLPRAEPGVSA